MILEYNIGNSVIKLKPYCTDTEKSILLYFEFSENPTLDGVLSNVKECFNIDISKFSDIEKIALLYKLRSISVGESIDSLYSCKECGHVNNLKVDIGNFVDNSNYKKTIEYKDVTYVLKDVHFKDTSIDESIDAIIINSTKHTSTEVITHYLDDLYFDEYKELEQLIRDNSININTHLNKKCSKCEYEYSINLIDNSSIIDNMSEGSLLSIYTHISDLVYTGTYTMQDVLSMLPFEREIYIGMLNKKIDEETPNA